ncbi:MAG: hypothetical protein IH831_09680 [Planctomycetes bacterium]|nr:hypothetical protein [Planctomycetota bacterium]
MHQIHPHRVVDRGGFALFGLADVAVVLVSSPLKNSFGLRAAEIRQLDVAESRHIFGYAYESAP